MHVPKDLTGYEADPDYQARAGKAVTLQLKVEQWGKVVETVFEIEDSRREDSALA